MTRVYTILLLVLFASAMGLFTGCGSQKLPVSLETPAGPEPSTPAAQAPSVRPAVLEAERLTPRGLFVSRTPRRQVSSLLVAGDSLSISLAEQLERGLAQDGRMRFGRLGKVSSGLARPDFFDWEAAMEILAGRMKPEVALIMLGTNDSKLLRGPDGSQLGASFATPEWDQAYAARVQRIISICRKGNPGVLIFWVGSPVMSDPTLSRELEHVNAVIARTVAANRDCYFVETWDVFSGPDREFVMHKPGLSDGMPLRARDGVHLTQAGAQALAERCLWVMESRVRWPRPQGQAEQSGARLADAS